MTAQHEKEARGILRITGAVVTNDHFVYTGGDHGSVYINKDALFVYPEWFNDIALFLSEEVAGDSIETVVGAAVGGAILANRIAEHLGKITRQPVNAVFADRDGDGFVVKRGYPEHVTGKRCLIVEDVLNTGKTVQGLIRAVHRVGGCVVRIAAICNRGGVTAEDLGFPSYIVNLIDERQEKWPEAECPLCKSGVPVNTDLGKGMEFLARKRQQT